MTYLLRVISIFIISLFLFSLADFSFADYLLSPLAGNNESTSLNPNPFPLYPNSYSPSITFGDLLSINLTPSVIPNENSVDNQIATESRMAKIKALLAQLEDEYRNSFLRPTPFIPIPTFIAGISEIVVNQSGILGSQQNVKDTSDQNQLPTYAGNLAENPIKTAFTIAILGDSMVDTLGRDLPHLKRLLSEAYPAYSFLLLNYGFGATDMESGLYRLTNNTDYLGVSYPPLLSFKPDILVIESFAYNHWTGEKHDLDRQWLTIAKIIDTVRANSPETKIVLAATIAPNSQIYGDGALNWLPSLKEEASLITKAYLQNLINFATSQNYPLVDAYHPSLGPDGNGLTQYINQGDHLHPSDEGALLFSQKIVEVMKTIFNF